MSKPWRWTAQSLAPATSEGKKVKCEVRLLDTVFLGKGGTISDGDWLFTSKHGTVTLKKKDQVTCAKVNDRFTRFATLNPLNNDKFVAKAMTSTGKPQCLTSIELRSYLNGELNEKQRQSFSSLDNLALQVYLRPRGGVDDIIVCDCFVNSNDKSNGDAAAGVGGGGLIGKMQIQLSLRQNGQEKALSNDWEPHIRNEIESSTKAILRHIEASHSGLIVEQIRAEYMLDDNHQPWLTIVPTLYTKKVASSLSLPRIPSRGTENEMKNNRYRPSSEPNRNDAYGVNNPSVFGGGGGGDVRPGSREGSYADQKAAMRQHLSELRTSSSQSASGRRQQLLSQKAEKVHDDIDNGDGGGEAWGNGIEQASKKSSSRKLSSREKALRNRYMNQSNATNLQLTKHDDDDENHDDNEERNVSIQNDETKHQTLNRKKKKKATSTSLDSEKVACFASEQGQRRKEILEKAMDEQEQYYEDKFVNNPNLDDNHNSTQSSSSSLHMKKGKINTLQTLQKKKKQQRAEAELQAELQAELDAALDGKTITTMRDIDDNDVEEEEERENLDDQEMKLLKKLEELKKTKAALAGEDKGFASTMSQSEVEFQQRRLKQTDSTIAQPTHSSSSSSDGQNDKDGKKKTVDQLESQVKQLNQDIIILERRLSVSQHQRGLAIDQAKDLANKLTQAQNQFSLLMSEKDASAQQLRLSLETQHHDKMAELLKQTAHVKGDTVLAEASKETAQLIARVEGLGRDLSEKERLFNAEKRKMSSEAAAALQTLAAEHRGRLAVEAKNMAELEDKVTDLEGQFSEAKQALINSAKKEEELIERKLKLEQTNNELRTEIRALQQSFSATTSLDVVQGESVRDGETMIATLSAQSEARIRQLNNKVEFLKSSLAGEQQRYSELEGKLGLMRGRLEETQQEMKKRAIAAQEAASNAVALAEKNMRAQVDDALQESSQLQAKTAALQSQLGDALNDVAIAKRREDGHRSEASQLQARLEAAQAQMSGLGHESDSLNEALKREEAADAKRASAEALMRRLDNERSYLRSQLTSEVTLKLELQTTLDQATRNLGEIKQTYAAERDAAESKWNERQTALESENSELCSANMELSSESEERGKRLEATLALFAKTRDQLRLDQQSLESMKAVNRRLVEELKAAQDEIASSNTAAAAAEKRASESMNSLLDAVSGNAASSETTITKLRQDLQKAMKSAAEAQNEMLLMKKSSRDAKNEIMKEAAAARIHRGLGRLAKLKAGNYLAKWRRTAKEISIEIATKERVSNALNDAEIQFNIDKDKACVIVADSLKKERQEMMNKFSEEAMNQQALAVSQALDNLTKDHDKAKEEMMRHHNARIDTLNQERDDALSNLQAEHEQALQRLEEDSVGRASHSVREMAQKAAQEKQIALAQEEEKWRQIVREREESLRLEKEEALEALAQEHHLILQEHNEALRNEREAMEQASRDAAAEAARSVADAQRAEAAATEAAAIAEETIENLRADLVRQAEDHKAILAIEKEEAVRDARVTWQEEMKELKEQWQIESDSILQLKLENLKQEEEKKKLQAIKFEQQKYEKEVEDIDRRHGIELEGAFRRGVEERNLEALKEKKSIHEAATKAVNDVKTTAKDSIELAMKDGKELSIKTHKQGYEKGVIKANKENELILSNLNHKHELEIANLNTKANDDKNKACEIIRKEERKINDDLRYEFTRQREMNILESERLNHKIKENENIINTLNNDLTKNKQNYELKYEKQINEFEKKLLYGIEEEKIKNLKEHNETMKEYELTIKNKIKKACNEAEEKVAAEMGAAMEQLQDESEKLLSQLEARLRVVEKERDEKNSELMTTRNELDEHGDTIYDLENDLIKIKKEKEDLILKSNNAIANVAAENAKLIQNMKKQQDDELKQILKKNKEALKLEKLKTIEAEKLISDAESYRSEMHDTLVNHKRESLLKHQSESGKLQKQLEAVALERDGIEARKDKTLDEMSEMERGVRNVEHQLRDHSQQSAVEGGRINLAYQRKKKRLDEEYEALLTAIDTKRIEIDEQDRKLEDCDHRSRKLEDNLKALERLLVEVLVDQQKKLLKILTEAGQANVRYMKEREKYAMVHGTGGGSSSPTSKSASRGGSPGGGSRRGTPGTPPSSR